MRPLTPEAQTNFTFFRDCLSTPIIYRSAPRPNNGKRKRPKSRNTAIATASTFSTTVHADTTDAEDLGDFVEYIALEIFASFPAELQNLSYAAIKGDERLAATYTAPLPPSTVNSLLVSVPPTVTDSLQAYALLSDPTDLPNFLTPVLQEYATAATTPPPPLLPTQKASACEICQRDWVPLTYHHLIPRSTHAKVVKRGWHPEWRLNSVAWLCRACHSFVHRCNSNEELAKEYWSVERLLQREDMKDWAKWVERVRWKSR